MKYWESATIFSMNPTTFSPKTIRIVNLIGTITYTGVIVAMYIWSMCTFPGYSNIDSFYQFDVWYSGYWQNITLAFWLVITFTSTTITIFAICKILRTSKELTKHNTNITINKRSMILHGLLLTLQSLVSVFYTLAPYIPALYNRWQLINIVLIAVDVIVQIVICYICVTMGSNVYLRKFKMTLLLT